MSQLNTRSLRSGSVSESLSRSMAALYDVFATAGTAGALAQALDEAFLTVNNPDPRIGDSLLVCLRDVCGEGARDELVREALAEEVRATLSLQTLFRSGSIGTRLFYALYRTEGADWLNQVLKPLFAEVAALTHPVEFDPARVAPDAPADEVPRAAREFEAIARRFFNHLYMVGDDFPACISRVLAPVCAAAEQRYPGRGASVAGIGLVVLRFVAPAMLNPAQFCVALPELSPIATRVVVVLSKVIQMVANGTVVKSTDAALQPLSDFVQAQFAPCADFIRRVTTDPGVIPAPPPNLAGKTTVSKELRGALKVLAAEIDRNLATITEKAKDPAIVPVLQYIQKPGKVRPALPARAAAARSAAGRALTIGTFGSGGACNSSSDTTAMSHGGEGSSAPPSPIPSPLQQHHPIPQVAAAGTSASTSSSSSPTPSFVAAAPIPGTGTSPFLGMSPKQPHRTVEGGATATGTAAAASAATAGATAGATTTDPVADATGAAHRALDEMLGRFRSAVLAYSGENFARVAQDCERAKAELQREREARRVAEAMVERLANQVAALQQEVARLRGCTCGTSTSTSVCATPAAGVTPATSAVPTPQPTPLGSPMPRCASSSCGCASGGHIRSNSNGGGSASTSGCASASASAGVVQTTARSPSPMLEAGGLSVTELCAQSALPCAAQNRQAVALLDEIALLAARASRVAHILYLARVVRELQRLERAPMTEQFEFASLGPGPAAADDSGVSFDDEKMRGLRVLVPECIAKAREWCLHLLEPDAVKPQAYPIISFRMQNLVAFLKDVSQNLRSSIIQ